MCTLIEASKVGNLAEVIDLITSGENVNTITSYNTTPLHWSSINGHKDIVEVLLAGGANINATDSDDNTPLHLASENGHEDIVEVLLAGGANVNATDSDDNIIDVLSVNLSPTS